MLLRVSLVAAILSTSMSGFGTKTTSADWYGIEIRSKQQAALEEAENASTELNLPRAVWFEEVSTSGASKPGQSAKQKSESVVQESEAAETPHAWADSVWKPTSVANSSTSRTVSETTTQTFSAEQSCEVKTTVGSDTASEHLDGGVAKDVDRLLNQDGDWFAPLDGAEEASKDLQSVAFEEAPKVAESINYLDELRELEDQKGNWIRSSVVTADQDYELNVDFGADPTIETQPIFLNDLEAMVAHNQQLNAERQELEEFVPPHIAELEQLRTGNTQFVTSSRSHTLAQAPAPKEYAPMADTADSALDPIAESLFAPITGIKVTGGSTIPRKVVAKKEPKDQSLEYMETTIPAQYVMGPVLGVAAPNRYPVCFTHNPLYFEDPNLERCGATQGCFTTACSAAKFMASTAALPYLIVATPPKSCLATLGDCPTCAEFGTDAYFREWKWNRNN